MRLQCIFFVIILLCRGRCIAWQAKSVLKCHFFDVLRKILMIRGSMPVGKRCRSSGGARRSRLRYYTKTGMKMQGES